VAMNPMIKQPTQHQSFLTAKLKISGQTFHHFKVPITKYKP